ncbi:LIM/homeobox protein Lhx9-like [Cotesia glomerata]|uniref:LIM/homeobox protein Lhx9-like n=1 Tax=Cotesia glomerata TaxID=32391 RepID=UPI001D020734|nr:LIM/homeobox protein Lhx9-like [Cotesia glomerata]XP_044599283.1 LIM/homeobox protein Lhx9-like [Cotesia glomerata]XP_044599285.1 LIM/homeobox protein Lhx9-like [Cotesia glomerata]
MNPHHPGHSTAYPHHPSLSSSPHHPGAGGPHHGGYGTPGGGNSGGGGGAGGASSGAGSNSTSTPDLPSPHSPLSHSGQGDPGTPYGSMSGTPGMGSNGHLHGGGGMMGDNPHHSVHTHPHLPGHPAYPPVNHNNNNCSLKQEPGVTPIHQCAGCGGMINERFLLHAMERYWHNNCLKCNCCHRPLADMGTSCYYKNNMILCKPDYMKLFNAGTCQQCQNPIPANEMVMKVNSNLVFHTKCFTCNKCGIQLMTGDKYCLLSGYPICEADWHKAVKSSNVSAVTAGVTGNGSNTQRKAKVGRPRRSRE